MKIIFSERKSSRTSREKEISQSLRHSKEIKSIGEVKIHSIFERIFYGLELFLHFFVSLFFIFK